VVAVGGVMVLGGETTTLQRTRLDSICIVIAVFWFWVESKNAASIPDFIFYNPAKCQSSHF
jgi:hypothetical protein